MIKVLIAVGIGILLGVYIGEWYLYERWNIMGLTEEEIRYCKEHPCVQSKDCKGAYYDQPHPRIKCGEDGHTAMDIIGLPHCLDWLYEKCPIKENQEWQNTLSMEN